MRHNKQEKEHAKENAKGNGAQDQHHSRCAKHALTALELEIDGENVSEDAKRARYVQKRIARKREGTVVKAVKNGNEQQRERRFQHIAEEHEESRLFAVNAEHIGKTAVAASLRADIRTVKEARDEDSTIDTAEKIGHEGRDQDRNRAAKCNRGISNACQSTVLKQVKHRRTPIRGILYYNLINYIITHTQNQGFVPKNFVSALAFARLLRYN
jgi:hypothetical protein